MVRIYRLKIVGFAAAFCIVLGFADPLPSQPESDKLLSPLGERYRQRNLSANQRGIEAFFNRQLPPGWVFTADEKSLRLSRLAPVYLIEVQREDYLTQSKPVLLNRAKREGKKSKCTIQFRVERHDDVALVRQKLRLYHGIRRSIADAHDRLVGNRACTEEPIATCAKEPGKIGANAREYLTTRQILTEKLEEAPFYRIGTLYLYPLKNQCVTGELDWYFVNTDYPESMSLFPLEAREEIKIILRNLEQVRL